VRRPPISYDAEAAQEGEGSMLRILGRKNSSNVQKVLWCCGELKLPFAREDYGGAFGGNRDPAYLAMNPNGLVPTIVDDGFVLWESNAIVRYLAARHGAGRLWPTDARARAEADCWMDWQLTVATPALGPVFMGLVRTKPEQRDMAAINAARDRLSAAMAILDRHLAERPFVGGADLTIGDIPLGIVAYRWFTLDIARESYPHLEAWYARLAKRPAYQEHAMIGLT
jgi:glutathione S-transferase